jgi:hypothetical protein
MGRLAATMCCLLLVGCGGGTSVSGKATYEGTAIDDGFITFFPSQPKGSEKAGPIKAGAFEIHELTPGPHVVEITATKKIQFAASTEELAAKFKAGKSKGNESADLVPPNAVGNRQTVEIKAGRQQIDFHLKKP